MRRLLVCSLLTLCSGVLSLYAGEYVLTPTDDTFLQRLKTVPEVGTATDLPVRRGIEEPLYNRYAIFRFDLSSYTGEISGDVLFRLYFKEERSGGTLVRNDIQRQLMIAELPDWDWTEASLTPYAVSNPTTSHNSQFSAYVSLVKSSLIDITSTKRSTYTKGIYWEWNLTDYVKEKKGAGQHFFTFIVYESSSSGGQGASDIFFLSKESAENKPQLVISDISHNANLSSIEIDRLADGNFVPLADFNDEKVDFVYFVPLQTVDIPIVKVKASHSEATVAIVQAQSVDSEVIGERTATIEVTAPDKLTKKTYTVLFTKKDESSGSGATVELTLWSSASNRYTRNFKTVSRIPGFQPNPDGGDKFNWYGSNFYIRTDSTGYFYVKKIEDRWWLIDPDGYAGIDMSVTTINTSGEVAGWAYDLLKDLGFKGAGNFITPENLPIVQHNNKHFEQFSYTRRGLGDRGNVGPSSSGGFFQRYRAYRLTKGYTFPSSLDNGDYITIMDPEFEGYCDIHAKNYFAPHAKERNLLGVFSDNEINFNQDQLRNFLKDLPDTDPNYLSALSFITTKGIAKEAVVNSYSTVANSVKEEYAGLLAEQYYSKVSAALKKHMPNHLYLGSRLHGRPRGIKQVVESAARWCDVISVNFYDNTTPNEQIAHPGKWGEWTLGKPAMITEFYVKGLEPSGIDLQSGAGYMVKTQEDRGVFYQNTCLEVLQSKYYVGWQYFRWIDDGASNKGIVSVDNEPWIELSDYMKELNTQVYDLIDFIDNRSYTPVATNDVVLYPVADTYINMSDSEAVNGQELILEIANSTALTGEKEAYLKFQLGDYKDSLQYIEKAVLRMHNVSGAYADNELKVYGVSNNDWEETVFSASSASMTEMRSAYGKLRSEKVSITSSFDYADLNVRNWLIKGVDRPECVTFRVTDNSKSTGSSVWHSRENESLSPCLLLSIRTDKSTSIPSYPLREDKLRVLYQDAHWVFSGFEGRLRCAIYTVSGTCVWHGEVEDGSRVSAAFASGLYLIRLFDGKSNMNKKSVIR